MDIDAGLITRITQEVLNRVNNTMDSQYICPEDGSQCNNCGLCIQRNVDAVNRIVSEGATRISSAPGVIPKNTEIARYIDHTYLKADALPNKIKNICNEAKRYNFASVCINPTYVRLCNDILKGSPVKVCTVIGFPLGATTTSTKAFETRDAIANGANEIDMVINIGGLKSYQYELVKQDIKAVVDAAPGLIVKVILETCLLTKDEIVKGCELAKEAGASYVKTSTGFSTGGATVEDIELMRRTVGPKMGVKASGGVHNAQEAQAMIKAGATRIGASAGVEIVSGGTSKSDY